MEFPWKKSKTPQQINREQKKQDSEAHSRMDGIYAELEQAKMAGYNKKVPAEEQVIFDNYFKNAILLAKEPKTVRFDTEKIDQLIKDSVLILENAQGCGTSETIKSCFRSIKYGLANARDDIPTNAVVTTTVSRRVDMLTRLFLIAQYSLDLDKRNDELEKQRREAETLTAEYRKAQKDIQEEIRAKPDEWKRLNELTNDPNSKLTGEQKEMQAAIDAVLHLKVAMDSVQLQIGTIKQVIEKQENAIRELREQIRTAEYAIDKNSIERIEALTEAFVADGVETQKLMDQLDECADTFNKAVQRLYADVRNKEKAIKTVERFKNLLDNERTKIEDAKEGRRWLKENEDLFVGIISGEHEEYEEENEETTEEYMYEGMN